MSTKQSPTTTTSDLGRPSFMAPGSYRKFMSQRLREIDRRGSKELTAWLADAKRIKRAFKIPKS